MKNYKFTIAYDGTRYYGWEHQPDQEMTIQGKLENVLKEMIGEPVEILGAGRTDAGVHAKAMVAHAHMDTRMTPAEIREYMNRYLPEDICVTEVREAAERFHSRYNAVGKTYCYTCYIGENKPIFNRRYCFIPEQIPDVKKMQDRLWELGYLDDDRDGKFGNNTQTAVKLFQQTNGLEVTGTADNATLTLMYSDDAVGTAKARTTTAPVTAAPTETPATEGVTL